MAFNIIVCAKQVPDTNVIKINPKTGTLIRDGVPSILNNDDANALEEALKIKDKFDDVHITVISMGPPQANDLLFECIAKGADEGILVSDRAVGGSDTWATSNTLEAAVRRWVKDNGDYDLIFTGRQAIDGDTAQVGPQLAEKLGLPQVSYVEEFEIADDRKTVTVKRQLEDGYELIEVELPCLLTTIKELNTPRYMTIAGIYGEKEMKVWNAKDIEVDLTKVGLEASPTNVFRSFTPAPKQPGVKIEGDTENDNIIKEKCIGCGQCFKSCPKDAFYFEPYDGNKLGKVAAIGPSCDFCNQCLTACKFGAIEEKKVEVQADLGDYKHVWVFAEQRDGKLMNVALELIGEGRRLAKEISEDTEVCAVLIGSEEDIAPLAAECFKYGAEKVYKIASPLSPLLQHYTTDAYTYALKEAIDEYKPEIVLYGATHIGRDFAPRIAARCNTGLTADCTRLDVKVSSYIEFAKKNTTLDTSTLDPNDPSTGIKQTRPAFGGNLMATIICPRTRPQMSTVRMLRLLYQKTISTSRSRTLLSPLRKSYH